MAGESTGAISALDALLGSPVDCESEKALFAIKYKRVWQSVAPEGNFLKAKAAIFLKQ